MIAKSKQNQQKQRTFGWVGKILWVNLNDKTTHTLNTMDYADYLGGRGMAARIGWEFLPRDTGALDPENLLIIMTGTLTGSTAPFSGRTSISALSPQAWPHEWFSRSNLGGHWGPSLKYAGYDGIVIEGRSDQPVTLWIEDGEVSFLKADHLWGKGTLETQKCLMDDLGQDIRVLTIGQAGENLSRIAIIATETQSAAGQGGFGAVMGSKNLKAVAVRGRGPVAVAKPAEFMDVCKAIIEEARTGSFFAGAKLDEERVEQFNQRWQACTQQCALRCGGGCRFYEVSTGSGENKVGGQFHCAANFFPGNKNSFYEWSLKFESAFEVKTLSDDYGINHWDLLLGIVPWLKECKKAGLIETFNDVPIDLDSKDFWILLLKAISFREGMGDWLAEGGKRAPDLFGFGKEQADPLYAAWGSAGHWDGHGDRGNRIVYPFWLAPAVQWAVDVRDPFSSSHGYTAMSMHWSAFHNEEHNIPWDQIKAVGEKIYGTSDAVDPMSNYEAKEFPAVWHGHRSVMKDSVSLDDNVFPMILSFNSEDGMAKAGGMLGIEFEYHLFRTATGQDMTLEDFNRACERIFNLERAIQIRQFNRNRQDDEMVIPYFEYMEWWQNPFLDEKKALDAASFRKLLERYYDLRGWNKENGWPSRGKLIELGLEDVAEELYEEK